jgi:putative FmdB family regulatory protein
MPTYTYVCTSCETPFERSLSISRFDEPQSCEDCGAPGKRTIPMPNFILKGDGWAGKNIKIAGQMAAKNRVLDKKQEDRKRNPAVRLSPNVDGERVDSWGDAQRLAASRGKNTESYDAKVREEKAK